MRRIVPGCFALVLIAAAATLVGTEAQAHALLALSPAVHPLPDRAPSIVVKINHEKCKKEKVCDYFAPASSCSNPPCCKRWHFEKNCEAKDQGADTKPATTCELCQKEGNLPASCVPTFSEAECLKQKATADKLTTNPSFKTICSCKFQ